MAKHARRDADQKGKELTNQKFSRLLRLILVASER
jgi:hypothetical protein